MMRFVARHDGLSGIFNFLETAGKRLAGRIDCVSYEALLGRMIRDYWREKVKEPWWEMSHESWSPFKPDGLRPVGVLARRLYKLLRAGRALAPGTYVFADIERLSPEEAQQASVLWHALADSDGAARPLNHPTRSLRRYELLRTLYECGANRFNVYRITEARLPQRYPVFLRGENDHEGPKSPLLRTREEVVRALAAIDEAGKSREGVILTEFCDTADTEGVYRKYGAFIIGGEIIPKHLTFSRYWANQRADLLEEERLAEERAYVETNPHEGDLREIFRMARIDYGKMDYAVIEGAIQVWEITTNPTINTPKAQRRPGREGVHDRFEHRVAAALAKIAGN